MNPQLYLQGAMMNLKSVVWGLAMGLAAQAHGQSAKHVEQGDSIYFCEQEAQAKGLVKAYDPADDSAIRAYVNSAEAQGKCGRFPPNANYGFSVLFDTIHDNIVKIRIDEAFWQDPKVQEQYWIDAKQAFQQIQSNRNRNRNNNEKAENTTPVITTTAAKKEFYDFCINIMPKMTRTSGLRDLTFAPFPPDGYIFAKVEGAPTLTCIYDAINGTTPVSVFAELDLTNKKLEFKLYPKTQ